MKYNYWVIFCGIYKCGLVKIGSGVVYFCKVLMECFIGYGCCIGLGWLENGKVECCNWIIVVCCCDSSYIWVVCCVCLVVGWLCIVVVVGYIFRVGN